MKGLWMIVWNWILVILVFVVPSQPWVPKGLDLAMKIVALAVAVLVAVAVIGAKREIR